MPGLTKALLWVAVVGILLVAWLPAAARARGCKECGGSRIVIFIPHATHESVSLNPYGYSVEQVAPLGGFSYVHWCHCHENPTACWYEIVMGPWWLPPGNYDDDDQTQCFWIPDSQEVKWCTDIDCDEGQTPPIRHHPNI
jgi:hypothetical protein